METQNYLKWNTITGFEYSFMYKGMWFLYDYSTHYISGPISLGVAHSIDDINITFNEYCTQKNKMIIDSKNNHCVEIGQIYKCGENTLMISDINEYKILFCDKDITQGLVKTFDFAHIESHILSSESSDDRKHIDKKYFCYVKTVHDKGYHSLNARTLIK